VGIATPRKRLLAGFLECGECGGAFHVVSRDNWGCSWRRNRGPAACANEAKIPQAILELALLHAVREALDEEVAAHALDVALDELRRKIAAAEPRRLEESLAQLDAKIARALDLAIELGDLAEAKERLGALRDERASVALEYERSQGTLPTVEDLMPRVRELLRNVEAAIRADVSLGRLALGGLLGENRVRVYADGRIEGLAKLSPETLAAPRVAPGAASLGGSGGALRPGLPLPGSVAASGQGADIGSRSVTRNYSGGRCEYPSVKDATRIVSPKSHPTQSVPERWKARSVPHGNNRECLSLPAE
jgi:hypothetical protein